MRITFVTNLLLANFYIHGLHASECNVEQPRNEGDLSVQQIEEELNDSVDHVCKSIQRSDDHEKLQISLHHGGKFSFENPVTMLI